MGSLSISLGGEQEYGINGVKYIVNSQFLPLKSKTTLTDKISSYLGSDFADLTSINNDTKINTDYVILTAGKEY